SQGRSQCVAHVGDAEVIPDFAEGIGASVEPLTEYLKLVVNKRSRIAVAAPDYKILMSVAVENNCGSRGLESAVPGQRHGGYTKVVTDFTAVGAHSVTNYVVTNLGCKGPVFPDDKEFIVGGVVSDGRIGTGKR